MNNLDFKPDTPLAGEDGNDRGQADNGSAVAHGTARSRGDLRASRRRSDMARLRMRTDDGFHLFRIY